MARTSSLAFPNMLDPTRNRVSTYEDNTSIVNRTRLLILSQPSSLYNSPNFGIGLERHLWQYNTENEKAIIRNRIVENLKINEPYVQAEKTQFTDGLLFTGDANDSIKQDYDSLKMTIGLVTTYEDTVQVGLNDEIQ